MTNPIKVLIACAAVCAIVSGCTTRESAKVAASVDQDFINAYDAFEMAKNPRAKVASGDTVSMSEGVWLGNKSTVLEHRNNLPAQFETDTGITILLDEPVSLQVLANDINTITGIPVKIDSQVNAEKLKKTSPKGCLFYAEKLNQALFTLPKSSIFSLTLALIASNPGARSFLGSKPLPC